jgi:hypothetical protein
VDIDTVIFLNYKKYFDSFNTLHKETYLCVENVKKDNLFDFEESINKKNYLPQGRLFGNNQKGVLVAMACSNELSSYDKNLITDFWKATKDL